MHLITSRLRPTSKKSIPIGTCKPSPMSMKHSSRPSCVESAPSTSKCQMSRWSRLQSAVKNGPWNGVLVWIGYTLNSIMKYAITATMAWVAVGYLITVTVVSTVVGYQVVTHCHALNRKVTVLPCDLRSSPPNSGNKSPFPCRAAQ